nr:unnamed protein product [Callosobruchus chinensis]
MTGQVISLTLLQNLLVMDLINLTQLHMQSPCANSDFNTFYNIFEEMLDKIEKAYPNANITISGDFNLDFMAPNNRTKLICDLLSQNFTIYNKHLFENCLKIESWCEVYNASTAETKAVAFLDTFMKHFNNSFPRTSRTKSDNRNKIRTTPELKNLKQLLLLYHNDLSEILQADTIIDHSKQWFNSNELFLSIQKTEICSFSLKTSQNNSHVRFLGIDLDSSLSWSLHIENLCSKLSKAVYAIKKVSQTVDTEAAVTAYYSLFHSLLSYGILSWGNASFSQLQKVFIIQKAAVRGIVNARPVEHCKDLFKHFKITTLFRLIVFQNLIYIKNNIDKHVQLSSVHGGVTVLPPDIKKSQAEFSIEGECIRYGIAALRNVGFSIAEGIVNTRHIINKRALESLIKSGAFDSVHKNRKQLYESMDMLIYFANKNKQDRESSQAALFGSLDVLKPKFENVEDFDEEEKLEHELFSLGFYLTNHPLEKFRILLEKLNIGFIGENRTAKTAGVILNARMRTSERGRFVILTLSDPHNVSEIAFYNNEIIEEKRDLFSPGTFVIIDLEASGNTTRLAGKDISEFTKRVASTIKELVLTTECTDSQKAAMELNAILKDKGRTKILLKLLLEKHKVSILLPGAYSIAPQEDIVNLYEFTFIAQQGLLQQEVEEMVQELAVSLKNIKADVIFQKIKSLMERQNSTLTKQELETRAEDIKEGLVAYSDFLEDLTKILWVELEEDLSNLKEVKSKIDKDEQITTAFIHNAVNALKRNISEHLMKIFQDILKDFRINGPTQSSKALEMLLENIEASGLIKYEHWGLLDFAYPINKMKSGHYCIMCISSTANILDEFVRRMKLNENVIRHLSVQVDKFFEGKSYMMNKQIEEQNA